MSAEQLEYILKQAQDIIQNDLRKYLNFTETHAVFTEKTIKSAIFRQLNFTYAEGREKYPAWVYLPEQDKRAITKFIVSESKRILKDLKISYSNLTGNGLYININNLSDGFEVIITVSDKNLLEKREYFNRTVLIGPFDKIKDGYREIINNLWEQIKVRIIQADLKTNRARDKELEDRAWGHSSSDLEHSTQSAISTRQISNAMSYIDSAMRIASDKSSKALFRALGLELYLNYRADSSSTLVDVFLGSMSANRSQATIEKDILKEAKDHISKLLESGFKSKKLMLATKLAGSDSRMVIEKKKVVDKFKKSLKKNKYVKSIKTIDTKLNLSKRSSKKKKIVGKSTIKRKKVNLGQQKQSKKILKIKQESTTPTLNLNALKAQINARLSMTVIKNMGTPALENRTGRFARSVQVTDVVQTSKGFPSIGYTYQKYPYQTFEPGFKQGSAQRDPRTLIDRSIREIASELLIGRFYTRRV